MNDIQSDYQETMAAQSADDLKLAVQIMAGLLSSGHYTLINQDGAGQAKMFDTVTGALDLLDALKDEMNERQ
jgi:hypothetical protein